MSECFRDFYIINGEIRECSSFDDSHVNFGKTIYEVIRVVEGIPLFLEYHMKRFNNSAALINKKMELSEVQMEKYLNKVIEVNGVSEGNIKFIYNFKEDKADFMFYFVKHSYPSEELYDSGVDTIFYHGERNNPHAKVINTELRDKVEKAVKEKNVYEAILVDREGFVTEGSKSNIFLVKAGCVFTSPPEAVLPGVTRGIIIELLKELHIDLREEKVSYKDIEGFDALFITGTSPKVLPIRKVEDYPFNSSSNEIVKKIMKAYDEKINQYKVCKKNDDKKHI
jgi:branched-chain amino acid aminotransferase